MIFIRLRLEYKKIQILSVISVTYEFFCEITERKLRIVPEKKEIKLDCYWNEIQMEVKLLYSRTL